MKSDFVVDTLRSLSDITGRLPPPIADKRRIIVAYSGGLDSSALLGALVETPTKTDFSIIAAHFNHNLQEASQGWVEHCRSVTKKYHIPFVTESNISRPKRGESIEGWAREQRYRWFEKLVGPGDLLVTAHHQDDQLETFMLQLIRGAGPHGLAGIRPCRAFGSGFLVRPMLDQTRGDVESYLADKEIPYIEDPSNKEQGFDRNYLRSEVLPKLYERWPKIAATVSRASRFQENIADDLDERATRFLNENISENGGIARSALLSMPTGFRFSVFRQWCKDSNVKLPERRHFHEIEKAVFTGTASPSLRVEWKNALLRIFRDELYLEGREKVFDAAASFTWNLRDELTLPNGTLQVELRNAIGISTKFRLGSIKVGYYQRVGERCHPSGRKHSQTLKKLFQEWQVPPWMRDKAPIIWIDGRVAAVVPYCICHDFVSAEGEQGLVPKFKMFSD